MDPSTAPQRDRGFFRSLLAPSTGGSSGFRPLETELATTSPAHRAHLQDDSRDSLHADSPESPQLVECVAGTGQEHSFDTDGGFSHISDWAETDKPHVPVGKKLRHALRPRRRCVLKAVLGTCSALALLVLIAAVALYFMYVRNVEVYTCPSGLLDASTTCSSLGFPLYAIYADFSGETFLDHWDFVTDDDPTHGTVNYVSREEAEAQNLTFFDSEAYRWYLKSDTENVVDKAARGRNSIRIESKDLFHEGLFVLDTPHIPTGCGTWPAFWMFNVPWPDMGEIDVIEGVHTATSNSAALHTGNNCTMTHVPNESFSGTWNPGIFGGSADNCDVKAKGQAQNQGCSVAFPGGTYGQPWNAGGGGVYAMLWDEEGIKIWVFPRSCLPQDLLCGRPLPATWGLPAAHYKFDECDEKHFDALKIVINLTFCGDWAGSTWLLDGCLPKGGSCDTFVRNQPQAFEEAYWVVNNIRVYHEVKL